MTMTVILTLLAIALLAVTAIGVAAYIERRRFLAHQQSCLDLAAGNLNVLTECLDQLDTVHIANCAVCDCIAVAHYNNKCTICSYWADRLAEPDALIIGGDLYSIGAEPTPEDLADNPKRYGSYGDGFHVRRNDGTEVLTHNLWHSGTIPTAFRPADNAEFLAVIATPTPQPTPHNCFDHLDYIGGYYPYECLIQHCHRRYDHDDLTAHQIANAIKSLNTDDEGD